MRIMILSQAHKPTLRGTSKKLNKFFKDNGNTTYFLSKNKGNFGLWFFYYFFKFYFDYLRFRPDVILTYQQVAIIPLIYKNFRLIRKPVIHYWWDFQTEVNARNHSALFTAMISFIENYSLKKSDKILTNSKLAKAIGDNYAVNIDYLKLGVEDYFFEDKTKVKLPGKNKFKILYAGELTKYKKVDKLIESVRDLKCDLIILGDKVREMEKIASENVYFLGFIKHHELPGYINSANVVAYPADQDGALKLFEYLAMGKCILGYNGRLNYILKNNKECYLANDFKEGIQKLIRNRKKIKEIEKNVKKLKVLKLNDALRKHLDIIENVVKDSRK